MNIKGIYAGRPALFQALLLIFLILAGSCLAGVLSLPFFSTGESMSDPTSLRITQLIASICMFLFPAMSAAYLFSYNVRYYLSIQGMPSIKILVIVLISMLLIIPIVEVTSIINQQMQLPSFLAPVETWMREQEDMMNKLTKLLLEGKGIGTLFANLFVIAVVAGVTEEFMFRGTVQRILEKKSTNHHVVIWTAAFLFSAFHFQFYGLVPRMLLGAYFGYLLYWSKNIWIPVIAHFFNNMCGVLTMSNPTLSENKILSDTANLNEIVPVASVCLLFFIVCVLNLKKILASKVLFP